MHVRTLVVGVERKISGGSYQLSFGNETSKQILYNTTAFNAKNALEALAVEVLLMFQEKPKVTVNLGHGQ